MRTTGSKPRLTEIAERSVKAGKEGKFKTIVCSDCLLDIVEERFRKFEGRAVVIDPSPRNGYSQPTGYHFSPVFHLRDTNYPRSDLRTIFEKLPERGAVCEGCTKNNMANFTWLPIDFLCPGKYDAQNKRRESFKKEVTGVRLCAGCVTAKFKEAMKQYPEGRFQVIEPPVGKVDGVLSLTYS
jgi:hypothetical protein